MLNRLPRHTPTLPELLNALGGPPDREVARVFGVTVTTIRRWKKHGAPRPVLFSLHWLTPAGQHDLHVDLVNELRLHAGMSRALRDEVAELRRTVARLCAIGDFGAANDPGLRAAARPLPGACGPVGIHLRGEPCRFPPAFGADSPLQGCAPALRAPAVGLDEEEGGSWPAVELHSSSSARKRP